MYKERAYDRRNAQSKCFFPKFTRDKKRHAKVLPARALCREIKQILNTEVLYAPAAGLLEPKPEPVDEVLDEDSTLRLDSFCLMSKNAILRYPEVKEEPMDIPEYDEDFMNLLRNPK